MGRGRKRSVGRRCTRMGRRCTKQHTQRSFSHLAHSKALRNKTNRNLTARRSTTEGRRMSRKRQTGRKLFALLGLAQWSPDSQLQSHSTRGLCRRSLVFSSLSYETIQHTHTRELPHIFFSLHGKPLPERTHCPSRCPARTCSAAESAELVGRTGSGEQITNSAQLYGTGGMTSAVTKV
jgi:hypothetical protein